LIYWWLSLLCGIKMFLWRLCSLLGDCSVTGCPLRTTFIVVVLLFMPPRVVWQGVVRRKHQIIYFYIVIFFGSIWHLIYKWIGIWTAVPNYVLDHFNQFSFSGGIARTRCSIVQVIWFATMWEIWKERNNRLFNDKVCSVLQVVDKIKSLAFTWLKAKFASLPFIYHGWWLNPFTCWTYAKSYFFSCFYFLYRY
jgi:hypothetical protein